MNTLERNKNMNTLYVMVGIPASGKSTYAEKFIKQEIKMHPITCVSTDLIRADLFGDINDQTHNKEVWEYAYKATNILLYNNVNVVFDACNVSIADRKKLLSNITEKCRKVLIVMPHNPTRAFERNSKRERKVPEQAIAKMCNKYNYPSLFSEPDWDEIIYANDTF